MLMRLAMYVTLFWLPIAHAIAEAGERIMLSEFLAEVERTLSDHMGAQVGVLMTQADVEISYQRSFLRAPVEPGWIGVQRYLERVHPSILEAGYDFRFVHQQQIADGGVLYVFRQPMIFARMEGFSFDEVYGYIMDNIGPFTMLTHEFPNDWVGFGNDAQFSLVTTAGLDRRLPLYMALKDMALTSGQFEVATRLVVAQRGRLSLETMYCLRPITPLE